MKNPLRTGLKLLLTSVVITVPAVFAVHLVQAVSLPIRVINSQQVTKFTARTASTSLGTGFAAGLMKVATVQGSNPSSLVMGVLSTTGKAKIDWNGTTISLQNGSYAYVGGEIIDMAPDAIGLLKLADGSSVYVCPGSRVRLSRNTGGQYSLDLMRGASRFRFRADKNFQVKVNDVVMSSGLPPQSAGPGDFITAEVHAKQKKGCVICGLKSKLKVVTQGAGAGEAIATAGEIMDVSTDKSAPAPALEKTPIPEQIMKGLIPAADGGSGSGQGNGYLCRCREIQRYAKELATVREAIAQAEAQASPTSAPVAEAPVSPSEPAPVEPVAEAMVPLPEPAPPVAPPEAPPLALAVPGAPDPFDPNVLPPPAAGEPDEPTVLVVAPPVVPVAGSGGGLPASPS